MFVMGPGDDVAQSIFCSPDLKIPKVGALRNSGGKQFHSAKVLGNRKLKTVGLLMAVAA